MIKSYRAPNAKHPDRQIGAPWVRWALGAALGVALALLSALPAPVVLAAADPAIRLEVEGRPVAADPAPFIEQGRTLVPVRFVAEALGAQVSWNPEQQQVTVALPPRRDGAGTAIILTIGQELARVGGIEVLLDVPAQIVEGRTFVPLRFVAETLGATVDWDGESRTVRLWRRPSQVIGLSWAKEVGSARIRLLLSEPVLSHGLEVNPEDPRQLILSLSPAVPTLPPVPGQADDPLIAGIRLEPSGRGSRLVVDLHHPVPYRLTPDPDGLGYTLELAYQVTGVELSQEGRVPVVTIRTDGPLPYEAVALQDPDRLVLDFQGATVAESMPRELAGIPGTGIEGVRTAQFSPDVTRVVLVLAGAKPYQVQQAPGGLVLRFPPYLTGIRWEHAKGRTRLILNLSGPVDPTAELLPDRRGLVLRIPQAVAAAQPEQPQQLEQGLAFSALTLRPGAADPAVLEVVLALPYYLGHQLQSRPGESQVVLDLIASPVYGRRIFLDAGHGGSDPGAVGPGGTYEKQITLAVTLRLRELLEQAGAEVIMARTDDRFVDLRPRAQAANGAQAEIFISIHANSALSSTAAGTETYYWTNHPRSLQLARAVHSQLVRALGLPDRQVRQNDYVILREAQMPAVLVELAFLSNPAEERLLLNPDFQQRAAIAIQDGIFNYFEQE